MKSKAFPAFYLFARLMKSGHAIVKPTLSAGAKPEIHVSAEVFSELTGLKPSEHPEGIKIKPTADNMNFLNTISKGTMTAATIEVLMDSAKIFHVLGEEGPEGLAKQARNFVRSQDSENISKALLILRRIHSELGRKVAVKGKQGNGKRNGAKGNGKGNGDENGPGTGNGLEEVDDEFSPENFVEKII